MFMLIYTPVTDFWHEINKLQLYFFEICLLVASRNFDYHLDNSVSFELSKKKSKFFSFQMSAYLFKE